MTVDLVLLVDGSITRYNGKTVVKASSDRRLTPPLITFGDWLHSHCIIFLKGSEILCVLIKVFLLLLSQFFFLQL